MEDLSLEKEFNIHVLLHKQRIVEAKLQCFYRDMACTGVTIPSFMEKTPEEKAREHLLDLINEPEKFERTYECIWNEVKWSLP